MIRFWYSLLDRKECQCSLLTAGKLKMPLVVILKIKKKIVDTVVLRYDNIAGIKILN
jgi:hypothetical protein